MLPHVFSRNLGNLRVFQRLQRLEFTHETKSFSIPHSKCSSKSEFLSLYHSPNYFSTNTSHFSYEDPEPSTSLFKKIILGLGFTAASAVAAIWYYNEHLLSFQGLIDHESVSILENPELFTTIFDNHRVCLTSDFGHGTTLGSIEFNIHTAPDSGIGKLLARIEEVVSIKGALGLAYLQHRPVTLKLNSTSGHTLLYLHRPWYMWWSHLEVYDGKYNYIGKVSRTISFVGRSYNLYVNKSLLEQSHINLFHKAFKIDSNQRDRVETLSNQYDLSFDNVHILPPVKQRSKNVQKFGKLKIWPLFRHYYIKAKGSNPSSTVYGIPKLSNVNDLGDQSDDMVVDLTTLDFKQIPLAERKSNQIISVVKPLFSLRELLVRRRKQYLIQFGSESVSFGNISKSFPEDQEPQESFFEKLYDFFIGLVGGDLDQAAKPLSTDDPVDTPQNLQHISPIYPSPLPPALSMKINPNVLIEDAHIAQFYNTIADKRKLTLPEKVIVLSTGILMDIDNFFRDKVAQDIQDKTKAKIDSNNYNVE